MMKRLLTILCIPAALLLLGSTEGWSLPPCEGSRSTWTNCFGAYTYAGGEKYVGEYKDGKPHGQGTNTLPSGEKYVGEWKDGKARGQGTSTWPNGNKYVGEVKDGKKHGQGTYTTADGEKYVGEYRDGKRNGQGTSTWPDGRKYVGEYKDGKAHGQGTGTFADGRVWKGLFSDDNFVSGRKYAAGEAPSSEGPYSGAVPSMGIDAAKAQCEDLGFNKGTEAFGECVLKLIR